MCAMQFLLLESNPELNLNKQKDVKGENGRMGMNGGIV